MEEEYQKMNKFQNWIYKKKDSIAKLNEQVFKEESKKLMTGS